MAFLDGSRIHFPWDFSRGLAATLGLDPVCQALGGLTDNIDVHAVGTGTQHTAQTGGAKLQGHGKAVLDLLVIALDLAQLRFQIRVLQIRSQPALILILRYEPFLVGLPIRFAYSPPNVEPYHSG